MGRELQLEEIRDTLDVFYGQPMTVLSSCLRGLLVPALEHDFIAVDFSSIEARVLAWLAGEEAVLEIFRSHGKIYEAAAAQIFGVAMESVTESQRQIGKVAVLSLGFGGGVYAFNLMAKNYGVKVSDAMADQIKDRYRANNPNIVKFWTKLETAALRAVANPGTKFTAGPIVYLMKGSFLLCRLPSGRVLTYPYPKIESLMTPWGAFKNTVTFMGVHPIHRKWERAKTYGGSLAENVTQAVARDLLASAMIRAEDMGYPVVLHVHDELVTEVPEDFGSVRELEDLASAVPTWAKGLPISAKGWRGKRYRK